LSREDGKEYRVRQAILRRLLGTPDALIPEPGGVGLHGALAARRESLRDVAEQLEALERKGALTQDTFRLCNSYVHLHCNRLLAGDSATEQRALQLLRRTREGLARAPSR
jgi:thiopeptide-type bacteriocin biosynthesis protein